jgi:type VI protein secretion system component VasF
MDQFENDLRKALRQVDPPEGFEQRVLARLAQETAAARRPRVSRFTGWAVAAGFALAFFGGVAMYRQQQQERRALQARDQLVLALRVTSQKLDVVRSRINTGTKEDQQQ